MISQSAQGDPSDISNFVFSEVLILVLHNSSFLHGMCEAVEAFLFTPLYKANTVPIFNISCFVMCHNVLLNSQRISRITLAFYYMI
jgi:hypothetical protein